MLPTQTYTSREPLEQRFASLASEQQRLRREREALLQHVRFLERRTNLLRQRARTIVQRLDSMGTALTP